MGLGLDRFIVTWPTQDSRIASSLRKGAAVFNPGPVSAPIVNTRLRPGRTSEPATLSLPSEEVVRIEIPEDIQTAKKETPDRGSEWRECTRRAFQYYLGSGYSISSFYRDPEDHRCFYVLTLST